MGVFLLILLVLFCCFALIVFFGAPYVPTLKKQQKQAFDLLDLKTGQTLLELGSGDGRFLLSAAKRGVKVVGYELNPVLYLISKLVTYKYREFITIKMANYWVAKWPKTDAIYVFSTKNHMAKLNKNIIRRKLKNVKLVSYAFDVPGRKADKKLGPMLLYKY